MSTVQIQVPLSRLVAGRRNPRKVKPSRESQERLVALIRSQGLLQPLVVRPAESKAKSFVVIAGERRLAALKEIHRNDGDPKIPCVLKDVDQETADAVSLGENFGREPMHPLDEAEAFAKLVNGDGKTIESVAADFGVSDTYVRQRMKLASLAKVVKEAFREGSIDTAIAQAFAAVPEDRQVQVWEEVGGHPRHADHVRNVISNGWIDATHAMFDVSTLPDSVVSRDLFSERILVERQAFLSAQAEALDKERGKLTEDGWKQVVIGPYEDIADQARAMDVPQRELDIATQKKLAKIADRRQALEEKFQQTDESDEKAISDIQDKIDALEEQEREIEQNAPEIVSEETKAVATMFLMRLPDGQVKKEYRIPRQHGRRSSTAGGHVGNGADGGSTEAAPPTSDDLSDRQLADTFTHQALAVRKALLDNSAARRRVLALILHEKVRSEAIAIRRDTNSTSVHAGQNEGFTSPALDQLKSLRNKLDPFIDQPFVDDSEAYEKIAKLSPTKLDALIDLLIVECITAHLSRPTELIVRLASELKINIRDFWRPDATWLSGYQKIQLQHLTVELRGKMNAPSPDRKKSDLVITLAHLFEEAATGKLEDKALEKRANGWTPTNLRPNPLRETRT